MQRVARCVAPGLLAASLGAGWGCGTTDIPVLATERMDAAVEAQALAPTVDASSAGTEQEYCKGSGPPVLVDTTRGGGSASTCPDQLAQRAFRYALCACANYVSTQALVTDAFDSTQGPYGLLNVTAGGSVGINGDLHPGSMNIGGSLWATNITDITTSTPMEVSGELHAQGEMHPGSLVVRADAWMESGIQTSGDVAVKGTLHIPATAPRNVTGTFTTGAIDTSMSFQTLPPACDCEGSQFVDVAGVVRTYEGQSQNDDVTLGILPTMLENESDSGATPPISLPCGRIFFTRIGGDVPIHLIAEGPRVALFVQGDLSTTSDFRIDVQAGSELDLFVGGNVTVGGVFQVGDPSNPARARIYVGGTSVNLRSASTLAGNFYAPGATITLGGSAPTTLYGSIFASQVSSESDLTIHYDKAILTQSSVPACAAATTCSSSCDCSGEACNSGTCGPCADSSQCCMPLVCNAQGRCVADVTVTPR